VATGAPPVHLASAELVQAQGDDTHTYSHAPAHQAARRVAAPAALRLASVEESVRHERPSRTARRSVPSRHVTESHLFVARAASVMPAPRAPMGAQVLSVRAVAASTPPLPPPMGDTGGSMLGMAQSSESGN
jgi:hypothetical protein